jgi:hypothetical protein
MIITIVDIIYSAVFYLERDVSETGCYLCHQVEPTQVDPIDRASVCLQTPLALYIRPK